MFKKILHIFLILVVGVCVGACAMFGSAMIPTENIRKNIQASIEEPCNEGYTYNPGFQNRGGTVDIFTDSIILFACCNERTTSVIEHSMNVEVVKDKPVQNLYNYLNGEEVKTDEYARYWHGYQVILKPLLSVFSYNTVKIINCVLQFFLFTVIVVLLLKKKMIGYAIAYGVMYSSIAPLSVGICMQYSPVYYIASIAVILALIKSELVEKYLLYYFLVIGMLTSFMDLLTYPLFTLGIPLIFVVELGDNKGWNIKKIFSASFMWGIGYAVMWTSKWIVASLLLHRNVLSNAIGAASYRTGTKNGLYDIYIADIFVDCFYEIGIWKYLLLCIVIFVICVIVERRIPLIKKYLIIIGMLPFMWAIVIKNHTYVHSWFTYRIFGIFLVCLIAFILYNSYNFVLYEKKENLEKIKS